VIDEAAIRTVFADVLHLTDAVEWTSIRYGHTEGWDSLGHMGIVAELEDHFGIMLDTQDVIDMSSYERAVEVVAKLLGENT